ncbi:uncharacterized protein si:ch211-214p13.7 [Brienomyrus brachyistius]|uniref:uncharacterized protein si:ch211-214p13.7 n=1 Tax=Brienomyrus brachyistius TaxID=42636 RepID=UPI0020B1B491|nr:uncharacterized protein si:ch211-214p13.7 [Brienomyrus brachyistius]
MGCCLCRRTKKGTEDADDGDDGANKENGEDKEEVLYATIDHGTSKGTEKPLVMEDSCDYVMVNIPSMPAHQPCEAEDVTDEYVLMS